MNEENRNKRRDKKLFKKHHGIVTDNKGLRDILLKRAQDVQARWDCPACGFGGKSVPTACRSNDPAHIAHCPIYRRKGDL